MDLTMPKPKEVEFILRGLHKDNPKSFSRVGAFPSLKAALEEMKSLDMTNFSIERRQITEYKVKL